MNVRHAAFALEITHVRAWSGRRARGPIGPQGAMFEGWPFSTSPNQSLSFLPLTLVV